MLLTQLWVLAAGAPFGAHWIGNAPRGLVHGTMWVISIAPVFGEW